MKFAGAVAAAMLCIAHSVHAQAVVRGTLRDSLRNNAPIAHASVELLATQWRTVTDDKGKFEFKDIPPGSYTVSYAGARVDSLGIAPPQQEIDVVDGNRVDVQLAIPGPDRYSMTMCGLIVPADLGILRGRISGDTAMAPSDSSLTATWTERSLEGTTFEKYLVSNYGKVRADGEFVLCGVPRNAEFVMRYAVSGFPQSAHVLVKSPEFVTRRDLVFVPGGSAMHVAGHLVSVKPRTGSVSIADAVTDSIFSQVDESGRIHFTIPRQSVQLEVRSLGFSLVPLNIDQASDSIDLGAVTLVPLSATLSNVVVEAERVSLERAGFEKRKKLKMGSFLDDSTIARAPALTASFLQALAGFVRVAGSGRFQSVLFTRGRFTCQPRYFVDGSDRGILEPDIEKIELSRARRMEIYKSDSAPGEFRDLSFCGSIVIWTR